MKTKLMLLAVIMLEYYVVMATFKMALMQSEIAGLTAGT